MDQKKIGLFFVVCLRSLQPIPLHCSAVVFIEPWLPLLLLWAQYERKKNIRQFWPKETRVLLANKMEHLFRFSILLIIFDSCWNVVDHSLVAAHTSPWGYMQRQKLKIEMFENLENGFASSTQIPSWIGFIDVTLCVHWCSVSVGLFTCVVPPLFLRRLKGVLPGHWFQWAKLYRHKIAPPTKMRCQK